MIFSYHDDWILEDMDDMVFLENDDMMLTIQALMVEDETPTDILVLYAEDMLELELDLDDVQTDVFDKREVTYYTDEIAIVVITAISDTLYGLIDGFALEEIDADKVLEIAASMTIDEEATVLGEETAAEDEEIIEDDDEATEASDDDLTLSEEKLAYTTQFGELVLSHEGWDAKRVINSLEDLILTQDGLELFVTSVDDGYRAYLDMDVDERDAQKLLEARIERMKKLTTVIEQTEMQTRKANSTAFYYSELIWASKHYLVFSATLYDQNTMVTGEVISAEPFTDEQRDAVFETLGTLDLVYMLDNAYEARAATDVCSLINTSGGDINVRAKPSTSAEILRAFEANRVAYADGRQTPEGDTYLWYHLEEGGWVREDVVAIYDADYCKTMLPYTEAE